MRQVLLLVLVFSLVSVGFASPVAAQDLGSEAEQDTNLFCSEENPSEPKASASQLVGILQPILAIAAGLGAIGGSLIFILYRAAESVNPGAYANKDGKGILIKGWSVVILLYALNILADLILDIQLSCLMPA